jgi:hypothetical protein
LKKYSIFAPLKYQRTIRFVATDKLPLINRKQDNVQCAHLGVAVSFALQGCGKPFGSVAWFTSFLIINQSINLPQ